MKPPTLDEIISYLKEHIDGRSAAVLSVNEMQTLMAALAAPVPAREWIKPHSLDWFDPEDKRRPLGVLWQHSETGRKTVEFANEPKGPTHWAGWHPIGMIYLDMTPPPAADK